MDKIKMKIVSLLLALSALTVFCAPSARADHWGANLMAAQYQITVEKLLKSVQDTIVANMKIAAIRIINGRLHTLLTGSPGKYGGSGSLVISNWQDFVYGTAQRYALAATNDFFNVIRSTVPNAFYKHIGEPAEKAAEEGVWNTPPDLQNYVRNGDASQIFSGGAQNPWEAWRSAAMPQNDLAMTYLRAMSIKQVTYQQQSQLQIAQGIAGQGYKSATKSSGQSAGFGKDTAEKITTPGSTIKSFTEEILQLPMKMLEYAKTIPEIVTGMVNQTISQLIQSGVDTITAPIDEQIIKARNQFSQSVSRMQTQIQGGIINATTPSPRGGSRLFR